MTLRRIEGESTLGTPMSMADIRRRKGMLFEQFCEQHPWWEWTESRLSRRMIDPQGQAWVPMWDPDPGVGICYDPELTPAGEEFISELLRRLDEDLAAGRARLYDLDELDDWDE